MTNFILASQSPRRVALLRLITEEFEVIPSHFDESAVAQTDPVQLVLALSRGKAGAIGEFPGKAVIGCDTIVSKEGVIFGKPENIEAARTMMRALSGGCHSVITGVCIRYEGTEHCFTSETLVHFYPLEEDEIEAYIHTEEPYDKAGGYGIQGRGGLFVESIQGDYNNVVGMPLAKLCRELRTLGLIEKQRIETGASF